MTSALIWDIDPAILRIGPLQIRYYGLLFALVLLGGFHFWKRYMQDRPYPESSVYPYFYWMTLFGILGARIGHCLFYEPERYLASPLSILKIWEGGLASHGGTIGLILGTVVYSYAKKIPFLVVIDGTTWAAAVAATLVRIGNFFNSEIVGKVTDLPWAVHFMRYPGDRGEFARHPTQIYEALIGLSVFLVLFFVDKRLKTRAPRGLLTGLFCTLYFTARFLIEYLKEPQGGIFPEDALDMGQYLSIPFVLFGLTMLALAWKNRRLEPSPASDEPEAPAAHG